jgi:putative protease
MCVSISGRCLLGAYVAGRHPNRGDCPQPCRLSYRITAEHPGAMQQRAFIAEEGERGVYLLNAKDLCTLPILPALAATGVSALKIEGRTKSVHYLVAVVRTYRQALDKAISDPAGYAPDPAWIAELDRIDHRPYTTGFYTGEYRLQSVAEAKTASKTRAVGMVKGFTESGNPVIDVKNPFDAGEELQVCPAQPAASPYTLRVERLTDLAGRAIDRAVTNCLAVIPGAALKRADLLRRVR